MKRILLTTAILLILTISCTDSFFEKRPIGQADEELFYNEDGIDQLLIGAYSLLDGVGASSDGGRGAGWGASVSNWVWGDVSSDDAYYVGYDDGAGYKYERHDVQTDDGLLREKWIALYDGISRSNDVMRAIANTEGVTEATLTRFTAEARFLRGFYHFELRKIFNRVPYLDETLTDTRVNNDREIWPDIEADVQFAADNLPLTQEQVGRTNSWGAKAFLAKVYLYQSKYTEAKALLDEVIASGVTSNGLKYDLAENFRDAFDIEAENGPESVIAVQGSVNDGSPESDNGNFGDIINHPVFNEAGTCCSFNKPSQNLVNSFKTGADGLPLLDDFNASDLKNETVGTGYVSCEEEFINDSQAPLDPRLDWTVGRRGIAYLDWGLAPCVAEWSGGGGNYGGPYWPIKNMFRKSQKGTLSAETGWTGGADAHNYNIIRFADVLLWAAECEVEVGSLDQAREYVNRVRRRARDGNYVMELDDEGNPTANPAANYQINEYTTAWTDQATARQAVRFERRLELGMEGHRFFDLVRWGVANEVLDEYLEEEGTKRPLLSGASFPENKAEYFPIPQTEINNSYRDGQPTLTQNTGYPQ